jgi:hypothetical protein
MPFFGMDDFFDYIKKRWPAIDPEKIIGHTAEKWKNLKVCLGVN